MALITRILSLWRIYFFRIPSSWNDPTVVCDYLKTLKMNLDFDFDLSQAIKQHEYTKTQKSREVIKEKSSPWLLVNL